MQIAKNLDFDQLLDLIKDTLKKQSDYTVKDIQEEFEVDDPFKLVPDLPKID